MKTYEEYISEKLNIRPIKQDDLKDGISARMPFVKIGSCVWSAQNCRLRRRADGSNLLEGIDYIINDGEVYYSYNGAMKVVPNGWHLPTYREGEELRAAADYKSENLMSKECGGNNSLRFNGKYNGVVTKSGAVRYKGQEYELWCVGDCGHISDGKDYSQAILISKTESIRVLPSHKNLFMNVRFIKN